jgi:hypothetical protein
VLCCYQHASGLPPHAYLGHASSPPAPSTPPLLLLLCLPVSLLLLVKPAPWVLLEPT